MKPLPAAKFCSQDQISFQPVSVAGRQSALWNQTLMWDRQSGVRERALTWQLTILEPKLHLKTSTESSPEPHCVMKCLANSWCLCADEHDAVTPAGQWAAFPLKTSDSRWCGTDRNKPGLVLTLNSTLHNWDNYWVPEHKWRNNAPDGLLGYRQTCLEFKEWHMFDLYTAQSLVSWSIVDTAKSRPRFLHVILRIRISNKNTLTVCQLVSQLLCERRMKVRSFNDCKVVLRKLNMFYT